MTPMNKRIAIWNQNQERGIGQPGGRPMTRPSYFGYIQSQQLPHLTCTDDPKTIGGMSIDTASTIDSVEVADSKAVLEHLTQGTPLDPDVYRRVHERAAKITEELRGKYGTLDIAVDLIRQAREE